MRKTETKTYVGSPGAPHASNTHRACALGAGGVRVGRVDDTEHALGAMARNVAEVEERVGIIDNLFNYIAMTKKRKKSQQPSNAHSKSDIQINVAFCGPDVKEPGAEVLLQGSKIEL